MIPLKIENPPADMRADDGRRSRSRHAELGHSGELFGIRQGRIDPGRSCSERDFLMDTLAGAGDAAVLPGGVLSGYKCDAGRAQKGKNRKEPDRGFSAVKQVQFHSTSLSSGANSHSG